MPLAAHHKPFWSARIARCRRGPDLVGALPAVWLAQSAAGRANKKSCLGGRSIHDRARIHTKTAPVGLESRYQATAYLAVMPQNGAPPSRHRTLLQEVW